MNYIRIISFILFISNFSKVKAIYDTNIGLLEQSVLYGVATTSTSVESDNIKCDNDLRVFLNAINSRENWALQMLDASGQEESGYLNANFLWMGSMSLCQNINKSPDFTKAPFDVVFTSIFLRHYNSMQIQFYILNNEYLQFGICVPKSCKTSDIHKKISRVLTDKNLNFMRNYPVELSVEKIKTLDPELNNWADNTIVTLTIIIFVITFALSILGSLYDISIRKQIEQQTKSKTNVSNGPENAENTWWTKILLCYSIPSNVKSLFDTNIKGEDSMPVVHGLKTFGMFYIVFVHYPLYNSMTAHNALSSINYSTAWYFQLFYKSAFSVDTYFCLGGFLISYLFFKVNKDGKTYNLFQGIKIYFQMITHRIIRLLPAYLVTISLVISVWRWLDNSYPMFRVLDAAAEVCPNYWWRNLLFITTWYPRSEMCITWTWYLSEDMQFYIVNCALLLLATKYTKAVIYFMKLMVLYSIVYTSWLAYTIEYIPTLPAQMREEIMYYSFSIRMAPYFVGVVAGYYFQTWGGKLPLTENGMKKGWILFILNALFVVQTLPYPNRASFAFNVFYVGVSRTLWGLGISWLLMACLSGYGGIINKVLSFRGWIPFSRTTFCVYLTNLIVVNVYGYAGEEASYFSVTYQLTFLVGNIVLCFIVGLIFSILFESPFVQLIKLLMASNKKKNIKERQKPIIKKKTPTDVNSNKCYSIKEENNYILIRC